MLSALAYGPHVYRCKVSIDNASNFYECVGVDVEAL